MGLGANGTGPFGVQRRYVAKEVGVRPPPHWGWHHRRWGSWWGGGQGESGEPGPCSIPALKEKGWEHHLGTGADGCRGSMCSWRLGGRRRNVRRPKPRAGAAVTV